MTRVKSKGNSDDKKQQARTLIRKKQGEKL